MMTKSYVDVLVPLPLERAAFTYLLEDERVWTEDELVGKLALVPFGRGRTITGIVIALSGADALSPEIKYKRVLQVLPYAPIPSAVLSTWQWAAEYYMCSPGEIMRAAIPVAFRPDGLQKYSFVSPEDFEDDEIALFAEHHPTFTMKQLRADFPRQYISLLMQWVESDQVYLEEDVESGVRPGIRKGWGVSIPFLRDRDEQERVKEHLKRSKSALKAIDRLLELYDERPYEMARCFQTEPMTLTALSEMLEVGSSVVNKLRTESVIIPIEVEDKAASEVLTPADLPPLLSDEARHIQDKFEGKSILLSYAPGSTPEERIPVSFIHQLLSEGKQVLMLCPSIALLGRLRPTLTGAFGPLVKEYHTTVSLSKRRHVWLDALRGYMGLYVGLRGTAWLPLSHLGAVVIIDEEDKGYRQFEPAPRFTASHVGLILAHFSDVPSILSSITPSVESMLRAIEGRYALTTVQAGTKEVGYRSVNLAEAFDKNKVQGRLLSFDMSEAIQDTLSEEGIALLFYQRKGFAKQLSCDHCHHTPECPQCHATYRYYQESGRLVCPVCGHHEPLLSGCPSCGQGQLRWIGTGVERLAAAIRRLYPGTDVIIDSEAHPAQMRTGIVLSTSYDAPYEWLSKASMIGVVQLDLMTSVSDFRANERTFQMLTKCSASAPSLQRMVVQYLSPKKPNALEAFEQKDYHIMLDHELEERHIVLFPPFARQIDIIIQSSHQASAYRFSDHLTLTLRRSLQGISVMGPTPLPPHKKETDIGYRLTLLIPLNHLMTEVRRQLRDITDELMSQYRGPQLYLYFDVDAL